MYGGKKGVQAIMNYDLHLLFQVLEDMSTGLKILFGNGRGYENRILIRT